MSADYQRITDADVSLADALVMPEEIDFEPVRPEGSVREVDW